MAESLASQARYYRKQAAIVQTRLDTARRYRGRIKDVREHALWVRLADEIDSYLRMVPEDDEEPDRTPAPDDVELFA